jgi:L-lysine 6-transaminase
MENTAVSPPIPRYPGLISQTMIAEMQRYVVYHPWPFAVDLARCSGMFLATVDGQRIFDWAGYYGSKLIGHNHPRLQEPDYLKALVLAANNKVANPDFVTAECLDYYRLLHRLCPQSMKASERREVYAVNSGAEAVENMLKYLLSWHNAKRQKRGGHSGSANRRFLYFDQAFHGRTVYALQVTQTLDPVATQDFHGLAASGNIKVPFPAIDSDAPEAENDARTRQSLELIESILSQMGEEIVGIIVEPIQGAGGQRAAQPAWFRGLSALCHKYDVGFGVDEVQTSAGPTGTLFAIDQFDLPYPPHAVAVGKKFAVGALFMREPLGDIGVLDSTWGGGLADMVRFCQEWKVVEDEGLIAAAASGGEQLASGLRQLQARFPNTIRNVRGMGVYQGFTLAEAQMRGRLTETALQEHDLLLLGAGADSIRTRPNLSVTPAEIDQFLNVLGVCLGEL